jgi:hypothetical protein
MQQAPARPCLAGSGLPDRCEDQNQEPIAQGENHRSGLDSDATNAGRLVCVLNDSCVSAAVCLIPACRRRDIRFPLCLDLRSLRRARHWAKNGAGLLELRPEDPALTVVEFGDDVLSLQSPALAVHLPTSMGSLWSL